MSTRLRCAVLLWLLAPAAAQQPDPSGELQAVLAKLQRDEARPASERIDTLRDFLARHETRRAHPAVLQARLRLASLHLQAFDAESARMVFAGVRELAPLEDHDLRGRALYGLAQAQELAGDRETARATLTLLMAELPGTRYAEVAGIAQNRIDRRGTLQPGQPLPPLSGGTAVDGAAVRPARLRGKPLLLVAFGPDHDASVRHLRTLEKVWTESGMPAESLLAYAVGGSDAHLSRLVQQHTLRCTMLSCEDGFLHPDLMAMGIAGVPTSLLVGADHKLLLRDPPADRLRQLLQQVR